MFAELLAHPGVEETVELGTTVGFLAFHGGSLEQGTDVIVAEAARRCGASLYTVVQPEGFRWHIPSKLVSPAESPALATFLDHVDVAIAIHGFGRPTMFTTMLAGGSNRELARHLAGHIRARLPEYEVLDDAAVIPVELRGLHPDNPVNLPRRGGTQLELPPRVRGIGPFWADHDWAAAPRTPHTEALIGALAAAALAWPTASDGAVGPAPA